MLYNWTRGSIMCGKAGQATGDSIMCGTAGQATGGSIMWGKAGQVAVKCVVKQDRWQ